MIVALLNQKGGVGKMTLALHLAGEWAREGKRATLVDAGPQGSALDWSEQRLKERWPRLFGVVGLARDTLHREATEFARDADHVVIDAPPRVAGLMRAALLAADLVLIPAQPSPFDGWASAEILRLIDEARIFRPQIVTRFVLNRCAARTIIARQTAKAVAGHIPPVLTKCIGSARLLPMWRGPATSSRNSTTTARLRARSPRSPSKSEGWHAHRAAGEAWLRASSRQSGVMGPRAGSNRRSRFGWRIHRAFDDRPHAGAPAPDQGRAFHRDLTVAEMPRALFASEFPDDGGTAP